MEFNAQGLAVRSGVPRTLSANGGSYQAPDWGTLTHSTMEYDLLGRAVRVTQPGNLLTQTIYDGLTTSVIDPNGHKIRQEVDGLGQLIHVREYTGTDPDFTLYASTDYQYDFTGNLITVEDEYGNLTQMEYDSSSNRNQRQHLKKPKKIWRFPLSCASR